MSGKFTPEQKYEIIMESLNSNITTAELCRKHGVAPVNFRKWGSSFLQLEMHLHFKEDPQFHWV
jgi:transposase-like protein